MRSGRRSYSDYEGYSGSYSRGGGLLTRLLFVFALLAVVLLLALLAPAFISGYVSNWRGIGASMGALLQIAPWIVLALLTLLGLIWVYQRAQGRAIHFKQGRLPAIQRPDGTILVLDTQEQRFDAVESYNPTTHQQALPAPQEAEIVEADPLKMPLVRFRDLAPQIGHGHMLIGVRPDGTPRLGTWDEYKTVLVLGDSSSGKTNTIAGKIAEAAKSGAALVVCDPHANKPHSLTNLILPHLAPFFYPGTEVAVKHDDILASVQFVRVELERRVAGGQSNRDVLLVVEEWNRLQRDPRVAQELSVITEILGQEGRGFGVYGVFGAQTMIGFAKVRRAFISYIVHRVDEIEARLIVPAHLAKLAPELPKGATLVKDADGKTDPYQQALIVPADMADIAALAPARLSHPIQPTRWEHLPAWDTLPPEQHTLANSQRYFAAAKDYQQRTGLTPLVRDDAPAPVPTPAQVASLVSDALAGASLPAQPAAGTPAPFVPAGSKRDREKQRIRAAILDHPTWSNARIYDHLAYKDHNNHSLIVIVRQEMQEEAEQANGTSGA